MNEEQILALQANGYTYTGGGIIDSEGVYQSSVEVLGVTYDSIATEDEYNLLQEEETEYAVNEQAREAELKAEQDSLLAYEKEPMANTIDHVRPETYDQYMQNKVANNEPGAYEDKEDFVEQLESKALVEEVEKNLETGEAIYTKAVFTGVGKDPMFQDKGINYDVLDKIVPLEKRLAEIESIDEDVDTRVARYNKENQVKLDSNAWYNPENVLLHFDNFMGSIFAALSPDGASMDNKELKKEYIKTTEERDNVLKPEIEKISQIIKDGELDFYDKDYEKNYNASSLVSREDAGINNYMRRQLQSKVDELDAYVNDDNVYNLLGEEFLTDIATFGIRDAHDSVKYRKYLVDKLESGEERTEAETRALENMARIDLLNGLNVEQNTLYNLTYGAGHSVSFLGGGVFGRAAGKGVAKAVSAAVTKGVSKGIAGKITAKLATKGGARKITAKLATKGEVQAVRKSTGDAVGLLADVTTQATLHTSNLANTIDNHNGSVHFNFEGGKVSMQTDRMQYQAMINDIEKYQDALDRGLGTPEQRKVTKHNLVQMKEILKNTKEPQTWAGAGAKAYTGTWVEAVSEVATLGLLKGIPNNVVTRKLTENFRKTPTWSKVTAKSTKAKTIIDKINNPFPKTMEALNNFSGKRIGKPTIGGNLEEALEEVVVQAVPVWGETDAEASARKNELLNGSFYFNVLAQAPIQKIIMSPVGNSIRGAKYLQNKLGSDYRQTKKNFDNLMKDLQKEGITKEEIDGIMMAAGSGNFSQTEYKNKIKELTDQGKHEEANKIRENRIFNGVFQAMKHGKGKQFISALEGSLAKQQAPTTIPSEEEMATMKATQKAIAEAKAVMSSAKASEGLPNHEYILNLEYNKRNLESNKTELEQRISELQGEPETEQRDLDIKSYQESLQKTETGLRFLDKKIGVEKSPAKAKRYQDESTMMKFAQEHIASNSKVTVAQALKDNFGKSVSNQSVQKVLKQTERLQILKTFKEEMAAKKEADKQVEVTPPTETAPAEVTTQNPFGEGSISASQDQEVEDLGEEFKEIVSENMQEIETFVQDEMDGGMDIFMQMPEDEMVSTLNDADAETNPLVSIGHKMKAFAEVLKETTGRDATFEDFLMAIGGKGTIPNYQEYLTLFGNAWSNAGLGKVDVQQKYNNAIAMANSLQEKLDLATVAVTESIETTEKLEKEEKVLGLTSTPSETVVVDINGIPVVEQNRDEVYDEVHKVNYSALEFVEEEVVDEETGETYIRRSNAPVPQRNSDSPTNVNNLVNPNKNNKGDILTIGQPTAEETGKTFVSVRNENGKTVKRIPFSEWVEENRPKTGTNTQSEINKRRNEELDVELTKKAKDIPVKKEYYTDVNGNDVTVTTYRAGNKVAVFTKSGNVASENGDLEGFVEEGTKPHNTETVTSKLENKINAKYDAEIANLSGSMSIEEFSKTDEYISKVPMYYVDSEGQNVGWVAESEWFNASTEGQNDGTKIKVSNLSSLEKKEIEVKRLSALNLRKEILAGNTKEFEILSDGTSFVRLKIQKEEADGTPIPPKKLNEVAKTSHVAVMGTSGLNFVDGGVKIDTGDIINWGDSDAGFSKKIKQTSKDGKSVSYVVENAGKAVYIEHVSTINGVKKYVVTLALRKNEDNKNQARQDAIETVRILAAANTILVNDTFSIGPNKQPFIAKDNPYRMTKEQAQQVHDQVKKETGLSLSTSLSELVEGLVSVKKGAEETDGKEVRGLHIAKMAHRWNKDSGMAVNSDKYVQNTTYGPRSHQGGVVSISKTEDGQFKVEKIADSYEEYLKDTLSTNLMGYNVGTEENPVFTPALQQGVRIKAIKSDNPKPLVQQVQESKTEPVVAEKIVEIKEDVVEAEVIAEVLDGNTETLSEAETTTRNEALETATALINKLGGTINPLEETDELVVSEMTSTQNVKDGILVTKGLTVEQEEDIIGSMSSELANKDANPLTILSNLEKDLKEAAKEIEASLETLESFKGNLAVENVTSSLETLKEQIKQVSKDKGKLLTEATERGKRENFVVDVYEETEGESVKDYSKKSNEEKPVDKLGTALKRLFAQVETGETGFLGRKKITPFKSMYDTVLLTLSSSIGSTTDFKDMMRILKQYEKSNFWVSSLVEKLESSEESVQNSFVYNMHAQKVSAYFSGFTNDGTTLNATLYESNSNSAVRVIKNNWKENFKRNKINKKGVVNKEEMTRLYNEYLSWGASPEKQSLETLQTWLGAFGIRVSERAMEEMMKGQLAIVKDGIAEKKSLKQLFEDSAGVFNILNKFLIDNRGENDAAINFYAKPKTHPFENMHSILEQVAYLEAKNNSRYASTTRRSGQKTVTEVENMTYFYQQIRKLKNSVMAKNSYLGKLRETAFAKDSYMLRMLAEDPEFLETFDHGLMDLMSLKDVYKDTPMFAGIDELSEEDYQLALRIAYQSKGRKGKLDKASGFKLRPPHMNTLTNSDKGRMVLMKTFVYDFYASDQSFTQDAEGNYIFTDQVNELMYDNYVMPELRRMYSFIAGGRNTDIKGYAQGAERFNIFPVLNTVKNKKGQTIRDAIIEKVKAGISEADAMEAIKKEFKEVSTKEVEKNTFAEARKVSDNRSVPNDVDFMAARTIGTDQERNMLAEVDFILNSKLTSMNYMQMVAGDPAMYYNADHSSATSNNLVEATKASVISAVNIGKRMAAMIAPGKNLANSKGDTYLQVMMEDVYGAAENLLDIVGWHYSQKEINATHEESGFTYRDMIKRVVEGDNSFEDILKDRFSNIADFIGIESTDAQEYSTVKEHLYVLEKQGRIPQEILDAIRTKIDAQNKFYAVEENQGKPIPAELALSQVINSANKSINGLTMTEILLQPLKPVYTGSILKDGVNRMVYIKSSSFPLIPELTAGRKLDGLRVKMETLENQTGKTVRASYQSANKVGGLTGDKTFSDIDAPLSLDNTIELDREHFKIQQDVPNKSQKTGDDTVSMGTQIFKLLFGDGMTDLKGFMYQGEELTGEEMKEKFFETFSAMVNMKKGKFLDALGLDENMVPIDEKKSKELVQQLILAEAESRGFSKQDLKSLELVGPKDEFRLPLWATGNSNKFEAMLNALITNKIFKQKIPGNKFVTASEAGFEVAEDYKGVNRSKIIHIGDFKGGTLKSTKNAQGQIIKAEVLMPSRFKLGGKLIDIFDGFNEATGQGDYITLVEGTYQLREEMFDKEVLEQFAFRIPTSSHGLGSAIKIVGFLPPESGDLVVTPKGFIAQMGQDFDIDSLTAYQYHHIVRQDGKIEKLTEENSDAYIAEKTNEIATLQRLITTEGKYAPETAKMIDGLVQGLLGEDEAMTFNIYPHTEAELKDMVAFLKSQIKGSYEQKLLENKFVETHIAVFSNPAAQDKINKALSMAYAEGQAADIQQLIDTNAEESTTFDMLSPEYQRVKMNNGSTGSIAIGIYAKGVTLHSGFQQAISKGGVHLTRMVNKTKTRASVVVGNLASNGNFGSKATLATSKAVAFLGRPISTVLDERTNTATDNEKAQILGKTGLNHKSAIAVDSMMAMLGFDSEHEIIKEEEYIEGEPFHRKKSINGKTVFYKEYSIPYLLHSQPIVKEFFAILNQKESISSLEFPVNPKQEAIDALIVKYGTAGSVIQGGRYGQEVSRMMGEDVITVFESTQDNKQFTGKRLAGNVSLGDKADNVQQLEILALYAQLMSDAEGVKEAGQLVDMNNLGKSMWESATKEDDFREYFSNTDENSNLDGVELLVGDIVYDGETIEEGETYIDLGKGVYLIPRTNQGIMVGTALSLSTNLFNGLFPAKSVYLNKIMSKILASSKVNINNSFALIKAKEHMFQEMKRYITTSQMLGLFNTNAKEVRETLFTDVEGHNTSLSTYIDHLYSDDSAEFSKGVEKVRGNLFLNLLNFQYGEDGKPSLITFNNQESFEANQEAIFTAFKALIAEDISLPRINRNGETEFYSTRLLAQELIAYSYASGGIVQGALQFHKFLPIEYLDDMTANISTGDNMTASGVLRQFNSLMNDDTNRVAFLTGFEEQYFQNNPQMAQQKALKRFEIPGGGAYYTLKSEVSNPPMYISAKVSTKSKLKQHKWKLYRQERAGVYVEIEVLGALGMAEYQYQIANATSSVTDKEFVRNEVSEIESKFHENENLGTLPDNGTPIVEITSTIAKGEFGDDQRIMEIANFIAPLLNDVDEYNEYDGGAAGTTSRKTGNIKMNVDRIPTRAHFAKTFIHEALHNLTARYIRDFVDGNGTIAEGAPSEVYTYMNVFSQFKEQLRNKDTVKYDNFLKEYGDYKTRRDSNQSISSEHFTLKGDEFETYYAAINPQEFLAVTLSNTNETFRNTLKGMDYLAIPKGLMEKLTDVLVRIINKIAKRENLENNSLALQAIKSSLMVTKRGSEHNFKKYKKAPKAVKVTQAPSPLTEEAAYLAFLEQQILSEEGGPEFTPEGPSAGVSFKSITDDINNKCK
jgi:hypothetical protein